MYQDFHETIASISFDYHMYGSNIGTVLLQASVDGSSYSTIWSRAGNAGNVWRSASVAIDRPGASGYKWLRFEYTSGTSYEGDFALDKVEVEAGAFPSPGPTFVPSVSPSVSPRPSRLPTPLPSPQPTVTSIPTPGPSFAPSDAVRSERQLRSRRELDPVKRKQHIHVRQQHDVPTLTRSICVKSFVFLCCI